MKSWVNLKRTVKTASESVSLVDFSIGANRVERSVRPTSVGLPSSFSFHSSSRRLFGHLPDVDEGHAKSKDTYWQYQRGHSKGRHAIMSKVLPLVLFHRRACDKSLSDRAQKEESSTHRHPHVKACCLSPSVRPRTVRMIDGGGGKGKLGGSLAWDMSVHASLTRARSRSVRRVPAKVA